MLHHTNLVIVRDGVTFLCGIPGIQRTGTSLWWVPGIRWLHHILVSGVCVLGGTWILGQ
ncbi:unnamed protein product [Staurois parvus]|uniref:Uncharacterized protein n=1 Tax=Staurois parvus TaxID=386267 RepID=A0ABN9BJW2_9NEOB|nr:unnamed protein product [Staurois parvus]